MDASFVGSCDAAAADGLFVAVTKTTTVLPSVVVIGDERTLVVMVDAEDMVIVLVVIVDVVGIIVLNVCVAVVG